MTGQAAGGDRIEAWRDAARGEIKTGNDGWPIHPDQDADPPGARTPVTIATLKRPAHGLFAPAFFEASHRMSDLRGYTGHAVRAGRLPLLTRSRPCADAAGGAVRARK
jgi:hypothetical protein